MRKLMIKNVTNDAHIVMDAESAEKIFEMCNDICPEYEYKLIAQCNYPVDELPEKIKNKVFNILKAYDEVSVVYENNQFTVSVGACLKNLYSADHFVCGRYFAKDVYTKEQRVQNFIKEFGYKPAWA